MKNLGRISFFSIAIVIALACSAMPSSAEWKAKPTQPKTKQQILLPLIKSVIPGAENYYERAAQDPSVRPNYARTETYQNPIVQHLELRTGESFRKAQQWLKDPTVAPDNEYGLPPESSLRRGPSTEFFTGHVLVPTTRADAAKIVKTYGSTPPGMVLEGKARGIGAIDDLQYDAILNAFVLNEQAVYFSPIAPQSLAALCRAIEQDDRIGVGLADVELVYGKLPHESQVAVDLKLADNFLGNITFAQSMWLPENFPLAGGYELQTDSSPGATAVTFTFKDFRFTTAQKIVRASGTNFEVRLVPTSDQPADDGGTLPDYDAIDRGAMSAQFQANARHVAEYIDYYRRKPFVDNAFRYGEVAAFIRTLKAEEVDLEDLAELIEQTTGVDPLPTAPPVSEMQAPIKRLFAAWKTLNLQQYMAQWSPDAVQIGTTRSSTYADIQSSRARLFPRVNAAAASNVTILLGYDTGVGTFRNQYILEYRTLDDELHHGSACETYKVRKEDGRWVIIENREDGSC